MGHVVMRISLGQQTSPLAAQAGCPTITGICPAGQVNATDPSTGCPTEQCVGSAGNAPYVAKAGTATTAADYTPYIVVVFAIGLFVWFKQRQG